MYNNEFFRRKYSLYLHTFLTFNIHLWSCHNYPGPYFDFVHVHLIVISIGSYVSLI